MSTPRIEVSWQVSTARPSTEILRKPLRGGKWSDIDEAQLGPVQELCRKIYGPVAKVAILYRIQPNDYHAVCSNKLEVIK